MRVGSASCPCQQFIIVLLIICGVAGSASAGFAGQTLPASFLSLASASPMQVMFACAERTLSCGIEVRDGDTDAPPLPTTDSRAPAVQASTFLEAFNQHHQRYRAAMMGDVLVIRPASQTVAYLDEPLQRDRIHARGLMSLAEQLFVPLEPELAKPHGILGSYLGPVGVEVDRGEQIELTIDTGGGTVLSMLNEVATLAPGHPWMVVTHGDDHPTILRYGFVHRFGTTTEATIIQPAKGPNAASSVPAALRRDAEKNPEILLALKEH